MSTRVSELEKEISHARQSAMVRYAEIRSVLDQMDRSQGPVITVKSLPASNSDN